MLAARQSHIGTYTFWAFRVVIFNTLIHPDFENFDSVLEEALSVVRVTHIAYRLEQKQAVIIPLLR